MINDDLTVERLKDLVERGLLYRSHIPEYRVWKDMIRRCHNAEHQGYRHYGGRGIEVCPLWRKDFWTWFKHVGRRPVMPGFRMSIDRINNDLGYVPGNLRWATQSEQMMNCRPELTREEGCPHSTLTWEKVRKIRSLCSTHTNVQLANMFDAAPGTIAAIIANEDWHDPSWVRPYRHIRKSGHKVLTTEQVGRIRYLLDQHYPPPTIAQIMNILMHNVYDVKYGRHWGWVEPIPFILPRTLVRRL